MSHSNLIARSTFVLGVLTSVLLAGCAASLSEDDAFEQQYTAVERKEMIREFIRSCEANDNVVVYTGPPTQKLRDPVKRVPNHARRSDYQCTTTDEVDRMQAEMGIR